MTSNLHSVVKHLSSLSETSELADRLANTLREGDLLLFTGVIGAGKTTFIQALSKGLGITEPVTSPSFVLHTLYESGRILLSHVDLYRLNSDAEVESIGFEDYIDNAVTTIEWADRYSGFQPPYLMLHFDCGESENERILTMTPNGGDWESRIASL